MLQGIRQKVRRVTKTLMTFCVVKVKWDFSNVKNSSLNVVTVDGTNCRAQLLFKTDYNFCRLLELFEERRTKSKENTLNTIHIYV